MTLYFNVKNLSISKGRFSVVGVNYSLKGGDILGLVGRSGSGKSTILKALIGFNRYNTGSIELLDDTTKCRINEYLGYAPQENSLFPLLTLKENIYTFGQLYGVKNELIEQRMNILLKRLDLVNSRDKRIGQLSGGMQKRADLAVALIHNPRLIIFDEPFNGLDISLQRFVWTFIKELASEGRIIIVSSHMLEDLQKNCNQFGLVEHGTYYDTKQILTYMKNNKEKDLESFLARLFTRDLLIDGGK